MRVVAGVAGAALLILVLCEGFNTFVLARRSPAAILTRLFYQVTWTPYSAAARHIRDGRVRENYLAVYGPLSLVALVAFLALGLLLAFGILQWAVSLRVDGYRASLPGALFFSGTSLFTVGSTRPENSLSKLLMVWESGTGLSFLGLLVAYLPALYQSYSSRELRIALMDARAGSPPAAAELLGRQGRSPDKFETQLQNWETWAAELLQHQLSYPMLSYFRSQHMNQSWLASLTALLDATAITILSSDGDLRRQAEATFANGRHAMVDLARIFGDGPHADRPDRLPPEEFRRLQSTLSSAETPIDADRLEEGALKQLRECYEPHADVLSRHFLCALPAWAATARQSEDWRRTNWDIPGGQYAISDPFREVK